MANGTVSGKTVNWIRPAVDFPATVILQAPWQDFRGEIYNFLMTPAPISEIPIVVDCAPSDPLRGSELPAIAQIVRYRPSPGPDKLSADRDDEESSSTADLEALATKVDQIVRSTDSSDVRFNILVTSTSEVFKHAGQEAGVEFLETFSSEFAVGNSLVFVHVDPIAMLDEDVVRATTIADESVTLTENGKWQFSK